MSSEDEAGIYSETLNIISNACSNAYHDLATNWAPEKELGFVMIRRAMRHLTIGPLTEEMY